MFFSKIMKISVKRRQILTERLWNFLTLGDYRFLLITTIIIFLYFNFLKSFYTSTLPSVNKFLKDIQSRAFIAHPVFFRYHVTYKDRVMVHKIAPELCLTHLCMSSVSRMEEALKCRLKYNSILFQPIRAEYLHLHMRQDWNKYKTYSTSFELL